MAVHPGPLGGAVSNHRHGRSLPRRRRSAFRVRDWRMRTKLGAVLVIPSVAFLVLAGVQTSSLIAQATELNEFSQQTAVAGEVGDLVHALQQERDRTAGELAAPRPAGQVDAVALTATVRPLAEATDDAATLYRAAAGPLARGDVSWRVAYTQTVELIDQLPALRTAATGTASPQAIFDSYTRTIDELLALLAEPSPGPSRPELSQAVLRGAQMARVKELGSRVRAYLYAAARRGVYTPDDFVVLGDLRSQRSAALSDFRLVATPEQARFYDDVSVRPPFLAATQMEEATPSGTGRALLDPDPWWTASQDRLAQLRVIEGQVLDDAAGQAAARSGAQLRQTLLVAGIVLLVLLIAFWTSYSVGRSIVRSLRVLRTHALHVAQVQLPDALERLRATGPNVPAIEVAPSAVRSLDEIGEVAEAFVAVHRSAVSVAVDQALMRRSVNAMFVNLARRSQVLVERQLELLDDLEREESDPDQLDNLFKLDHLAARMRRNDDSLLVLAGTDASRRWSEPVALPAVVLAAVAEIEHYPRVRHDAIDPVHIVGHAVADVVHLLAELLENATAFSPPSTTVQVVARGNEQAGAIIEISDEGLGMSLSALQEANDLLAAPPAADVAASERMGLFVVSHLAARHRIRVELRAAHRGVIAVVRLPAELVAPAHSQLPYQPARPLLASVSAFAAGPAGSRVARGSIESRAARDVPAYGGPGNGYGTGNGGGPGYGTPSYDAPGSGSPAYGAPAYGSPSPGTPAYGSPSPGTPAYGSPSPGTPAYGSPSPGTPAYGQPAYGEPAYGGSAPAPVQPAYTPAPGWSQPAPAQAANAPAANAPVSAAPVSGLPVSGVPVSAPPPPGHLSIPPGPGIPVAGRQPGAAGTPWPSGTRAGGAPAGTRSGAPAGGATVPRQKPVGSTWWVRPTAGSSTAAREDVGAGLPSGPPVTPVTGGVSASGLPLRVPMAQLPGEAPAPAVPPQRTEADPETVGSTLSAFYSGVRRAESEETTDLSALHWSRREQESR